MATHIFLGEPPADIKQWIIDHAGPADHADTWYKYAGDTEWRTVSISGAINGIPPEEEAPAPTSQIPDVKNIVALEIGTNVTNIGNYAFWNCSRLTSVTIPDSVTIIGDSVFEDCSGLTNVTIPDGVTNIGITAFGGCSGLTSVTIPNSVTSIRDGAFSNCSGLTNVTIGNGVTNIGWGAFNSCSSLANVVFLGKTIDQVQEMDNYSWGISDINIIKVA